MGVNKFNVMSLGKARLLEPEQVGYKDSVDIIYDELNKTRKSFIKIGWYLKHIHDNKMYEQDGYANIYDLAMEKFRFSQPTTTRYINLCEEFSVNHNSPELDQKYEDYNISQLFEMLSMSKDKIEQVTPAMTVNEIREIKKPSSKAIKTFYVKFIMNTEFANQREGLKQYLIDKFGKSNNGGVYDGLTYQCSRKGIRLNGSSDITWASFVKYINELIPLAASQDGEEDNIPGQTSIEADFQEYLPDNNYATSHKKQVIEGEYREINDCTEICCAQDCNIRQEDRYCVTAPLGNPFNCSTMNELANIREDIGEDCQFIDFDKAEKTSGSNEPVPCCKKCEAPCGYECQIAKRERKIHNTDLFIEQSEGSCINPENKIENVKTVLENEKKELADYIAYGKFSENTITRRRIIVQALEHYLILLEDKKKQLNKLKGDMQKC